LQVL